MTNYVGHRLTITGSEDELRRFASCFVKAKEGDLFTQYFIDKHCDGRPLERPVGELYFDFDKLGPAKPEDSDKWVLNRWGIKWVACQGKIEVAQEEIKLTWDSGYTPALAIYEELTELFPLLTMEGDYCERPPRRRRSLPRRQVYPRRQERGVRGGDGGVGGGTRRQESGDMTKRRDSACRLLPDAQPWKRRNERTNT